MAYSLAQLRGARTAVTTQLQKAAFPVSSGINVRENAVELYVTDETLFNETLNTNSIDLPESVHVEIIYEPLDIVR